MAVYTSVESPRRLCFEIRDLAMVHFERLMCLPFAKFQPDDTNWWLVPSASNPAYKHTKYYFNWGQDKQSLLIGIHSEKGLSPMVSSFYPSQRASSRIMQDDWHWHKVIEELNRGTLPQTILDLAVALPVPIEIKLNASYVENPEDYDPHSLLHKRDKVVYQVHASEARLAIQTREVENGLLEQVPEELTLHELGSVLSVLNADAWLWVSVYITTEFLTPPIGDNVSDEVWPAAELWHRYLRHLQFIVA